MSNFFGPYLYYQLSFLFFDSFKGCSGTMAVAFLFLPFARLTSLPGCQMAAASWQRFPLPETTLSPKRSQPFRLEPSLEAPNVLSLRVDTCFCFVSATSAPGFQENMICGKQADMWGRPRGHLSSISPAATPFQNSEISRPYEVSSSGISHFA